MALSTQLSISIMNMTEEQIVTLSEGIVSLAESMDIQLEPCSDGDLVHLESFDI